MSQFDIIDMLIDSLHDTVPKGGLMADSANKNFKMMLPPQIKSDETENALKKSKRFGIAFAKILRRNLSNPKKTKYDPGEITLTFEPFKIKRFSIWQYALNGNKRSKSAVSGILSSDVFHPNVPLAKNSFKDADKSDFMFGTDNEAENINQKKENFEKKLAHELFFKSVIESMKDLDDEEVLELQIKILKALKIIQTKRKFKQDLKKYCAASSSFL